MECELGDKIGDMNASLVGNACTEGEGIVYSDDTQKVVLSGAPMGGSMSFAVWVLTEGGSFVIINFSNEGTDQAQIRMRVNGGNLLEFSADDDNTIVVTGDGLPANAWTFVVGTVEDGSLKLYQDGKLTGTNNNPVVTAPALVTRDNHVIGRYLVGTVRQFQIWSRVIGAEEVERLYNNTEEGASCLATPTLAPTISLAPTATVGVSFYMSDTGADGWNGATYAFRSTTDDAQTIASGTLSDGSDGSVYIGDFQLHECYVLTVGGGTKDSEIGWSLGEDYAQCNANYEYVTYSAPSGNSSTCYVYVATANIYYASTSGCLAPTTAPSHPPSSKPTFLPSPAPTPGPTFVPTPAPVGVSDPSPTPTISRAPINPSSQPTSSRAPTSSPTSTPSHMPSATPSFTPTSNPTSPTILTVVPETLALSAEKPATAFGKAYIVNQDSFEFQAGEIWLPEKTDIEWTVKTSGEVAVDRDSGNVSYSIAPQSFAEVEFNLVSTGLLPQTYELDFMFSAKFTGRLETRLVFPLSLQVTAQPHVNYTQVVLRSTPTLGATWVGLRIFPFDVDDMAIVHDTNADFTATLIADLDGTLAGCIVAWEISYYMMDCSVPNVATAGDWTIIVALDDVVFYTSVVRAECRAAKYEDLDGMCQDCPTGTECPNDGTTITSLTVKPGYWRSSVESSTLYECPYGRTACPGSMNGTNTTTEFVACKTGYVGPLCVTCDSNYFLSNDGQSCLDCGDSDSWASRIVLLVFMLILMIMAGGAYYLFDQVTSEKRAKARSMKRGELSLDSGARSGKGVELMSKQSEEPVPPAIHHKVGMMHSMYDSVVAHTRGSGEGGRQRRTSSIAEAVDFMHDAYASVVAVNEKCVHIRLIFHLLSPNNERQSQIQV